MGESKFPHLVWTKNNNNNSISISIAIAIIIIPLECGSDVWQLVTYPTDATPWYCS